jgi:GT2 family glycosyltransferase
MAPSIDVIVPLHGGWPVTERCLASLARQSAAHTVVAVDNASPDDSLARLRAEWPDVRVLELGANRGFAVACNAALAATSGEIVVLMNNDVEADPPFLERLAGSLAGEPRAGMAAPLLLHPGRERIDSVGIVADPTLAGFARLQGRPAADARADGGLLLGPIGAAAAYRREALTAVGGLDERIFMYGEELDLALRLRAAGWDALAVLESVGVHLGSASAGRRSAWQREQTGFGRGYLLRRWGVLRSRMAPRALLTEAIVVAGDLAVSRDLAALRGRLRGWRGARGQERRRAPAAALDHSIGLLGSMRLRRADYDDGGLRS